MVKVGDQNQEEKTIIENNVAKKYLINYQVVAVNTKETADGGTLEIVNWAEVNRELIL